jgi:hypothetical protein
MDEQKVSEREWKSKNRQKEEDAAKKSALNGVPRVWPSMEVEERNELRVVGGRAMLGEHWAGLRRTERVMRSRKWSGIKEFAGKYLWSWSSWCFDSYEIQSALFHKLHSHKLWYHVINYLAWNTS